MGNLLRPNYQRYCLLLKFDFPDILYVSLDQNAQTLGTLLQAGYDLNINV